MVVWVYLTGSYRDVRLPIIEEEGKTFAQWCGEWIEVREAEDGDYETVEPY